jgi:hypothetical protein
VPAVVGVMVCCPEGIATLSVQGFPSAPPPEAAQEGALLVCQLSVNGVPTVALAGAEIEEVTPAITVTV